MELVRANADLCTQPKLMSVIKARAGVHHHGRTIHLGHKLAGRS